MVSFLLLLYKILFMRTCFFMLFFSLIISCNTMNRADLLVYNAVVYTVDSLFTMQEAMVIKDGKILETGNYAELKNKYNAVEELDAKGKYIYPGFNDAHAHFVGYALSLKKVNLTNTKSWNEVLERVRAFAEKNPDGWITGRGWDQNDWDVKTFPDNNLLNKFFPDRPVMLTRIDGHALIANDDALKAAGLQATDKISGGEIIVSEGKMTGVLIDNAMNALTAKVPEPSETLMQSALQEAQKNCFALGITSLTDCGLSYKDVEFLQKMYKNDSLQMRMNVMLSDAEENYIWLKNNGIIDEDYLVVRSFKLFADGALGSRGACLLKPYHDAPHTHGLMLQSLAHFDSVAAEISKNGWQMATHAIGDSANREILRIYAKYLQGENNKRWRIEHAQIVDSTDFNLFAKYNIVPSVQPTHATSDMYWAAERLGNERIKTAYAYKRLLSQNGWLPLGTDFPVEDISPFKTFYAAVFRQDARGFPANGFQKENALTREQAIRGMTIWAARASFEENKKGSLEKGKIADFIILDKDLMHCNAAEILNTIVTATYIEGKKVY